MYNYDSGCWLFDRDQERLVYAWTKTVETISCLKCGHETGVHNVYTGIDKVLHGELGIRHVGLRGNVREKSKALIEERSHVESK